MEDLRKLYDKRRFTPKEYTRNLSLDWVFDKWYEKVILTGSFLWAVFSILRFVWRLF